MTLMVKIVDTRKLAVDEILIVILTSYPDAISSSRYLPHDGFTQILLLEATRDQLATPYRSYQKKLGESHS